MTLVEGCCEMGSLEFFIYLCISMQTLRPGHCGGMGASIVGQSQIKSEINPKMFYFALFDFAS